MRAAKIKHPKEKLAPWRAGRRQPVFPVLGIQKMLGTRGPRPCRDFFAMGAYAPSLQELAQHPRPRHRPLHRAARPQWQRAAQFRTEASTARTPVRCLPPALPSFTPVLRVDTSRRVMAARTPALRESPTSRRTTRGLQTARMRKPHVAVGHACVTSNADFAASSSEQSAFSLVALPSQNRLACGQAARAHTIVLLIIIRALIIIAVLVSARPRPCPPSRHGRRKRCIRARLRRVVVVVFVILLIHILLAIIIVLLDTKQPGN